MLDSFFGKISSFFRGDLLHDSAGYILGFNPEEIARLHRAGIGYWHGHSTQVHDLPNTFGKYLPQMNPGRILEVGCCCGDATMQIKSAYPKSSIIGLDLRLDWIKDAVVKAGEDRSISFLLADGYRLPFRNESFDSVFCMNNFWFIALYHDGRQDLLDEAFLGLGRAVKNGGHLFVSGRRNGLIFQKNQGVFSDYLSVDCGKLVPVDEWHRDDARVARRLIRLYSAGQVKD